MKRWIYGFFLAWGMFLGVPCPLKLWDEGARRHMLACLPLIGALVGAIWAGAYYLLCLISCPLPLAAGIMTVLPLLITGGIHLDGFMDVSDAILSRRDLETRQRILKDPHCGAFAVMSIGVLGLIVFSLFLSRQLDKTSLVPMGLIPVSTRACAAIAVSVLRPIKTSQYSSLEGKANAGLLILPILLLAAACALPIVLYGLGGLAPLAAAAGYWLFTLIGFKQLDGMNGDISGFALTLGGAVGVTVLILV